MTDHCMNKRTELRARLARGAAAFVLAAATALATPAAAAAPPLSDRQVSYVAREQPVGAFIQQLFADQNIPVIVSPGVRGTINGSFSGSARRVYGEVTRAFDLVTYYDGVSVYVYPSSEINTRTFPVSPEVGARVRSTVRSLKLQDPQNQLQNGQNNMLVATGTRRFIQQVEELARAHNVTQVMSPTVEYRVFYLRYAWAEDITLNQNGRSVQIPGVASILRSLLMKDQGSGPAVRREQFLGSAVPGLRGQGLARQSPNQQGTLGLISADTPGGVQTLAPAEGEGGGMQLADMGYIGVPDVVRVQSDSRLNAIIVRDVAERMATYESLIKALDVEPTMLEIEATIIDINTDRLRELGVNFRFDDGEGGVLFGSGTGDDDRLFPGRDSRDITPRSRGLAISTVIGNGDTFTARIRALEAKGAARIVSRPQVMTLSNVEAVFDNSRTFYVRVAGEREVDLFNVTAGTALRVTPHVTRDAAQTRIRMLVNIEDGSVTGERVENIPVIERAAINTQAMIAEGQSLLVGGLTVDSQATSTDQVPILGDIPILGNLFKTNSRMEGRVERLFLITPRVANMSAQAPSIGPRLDAPVTPPPPPLRTPPSAPAPAVLQAPKLVQPAKKTTASVGKTYNRPAPVTMAAVPAATPETLPGAPVVAAAVAPAPDPAVAAPVQAAPPAKAKRTGWFRKAKKTEAAAPPPVVLAVAAPAPVPLPPIAMAPIPDPVEAPARRRARRR